MNEYSDVISEMGNVAPGQVVANADENPEEGAKALALSQSSGVPPLAVYNDLDDFQKKYKAGMASALVRNNPQLGDYVTSHPLAPVISNDDYGSLDQFSQGAKNTNQLLNAIKSPKSAFEGGVSGAISGFKEGFDQPVLPQGVTPTLSSATVELLGRLMGGVMGAATQGAGGAAEAGYAGITGDPMAASRFGREIGAMAEYQMMKGEGHAEITEQAGQAIRAKEAFTAAKPWIDAGIEPPSGVHPMIDEAKAGLNQQALASLNADLARAQESLTRDRSSDMFQQFTAQHFGDAEIGIAGDRALALYGEERAPTPDDGLLGWVPRIEDKLALARETGEDVNIPIADWITKVDPKLANELNDDIRMWPGGVTSRESAFPIEPKPMVDAPLASVRGSSSLEPMFSIGDRKLELQRTLPKEATPYGPDAGFHDFNLIDQDGNIAGYLNLSQQKGGKELHVDMISGVNGLGARDFGPSLMRDMLRQIKQEFPEAETLTGHRVSGARDKLGTYEKPSAMPVIRLDAPEGWGVAETHNEFRSMLEGGQWYEFAPGVNAYIRPHAARPDVVNQAIIAVQQELARIAPKENIAGPVEKIEAAGTRGNADRVIEPHGIFIPWRDARSVILYVVDGQNMLGTARHEAIHHLRQYGFFKDSEWNTLEQAAKNGEWADRYHINDRYPGADDSTRLEESVADAYKEWAGGQAATPELTSIFEKMKDLFNRIKQRIGEFLGKEPTWEDIFEKVQSGEVGSREGTTPLFERASVDDADEAVDEGHRAQIPTMSPEEITSRKSEVANTERQYPASYEGATTKQIFDKYPNAISKSYDEWRNHGAQHNIEIAKYPSGRYNGIATAREVSRDGRPTIAVRTDDGRRTLFVNGKKIIQEGREFRSNAEVPDEPRPSFQDQLDAIKANSAGLDVKSYAKLQDLIQKRYAEDLEAAQKRADAEQKTRLTREWRNNRGEMLKEVEDRLRTRPDVAADLFLGSGELFGKKLDKKYRLATGDLTEQQRAALPDHYQAKSGLPVDQVAKLFGFTSGDAMVARLAEYNQAKAGATPQEMFGKLTRDETSRRMEAKYGDLQSNIMDEAKDQALSETNLNLLAEEMYAAASMAKTTAIDKAVAQAWAKDQFDKMKISNANADKFMDTMAKHGRDAERALIAGDPASALVSMQKKYLSALLAAQARTLAKEIGQFNKVADRFRSRVVTNIDPEYTNFIQQILTQVGKPVRRSLEDLQKQIGAGESKSLEDFVGDKSGMLREMPVMPDLFDPNWKRDFNDLTAAEFRGVAGSIKAMVHNGRDELKIEKAGEQADLAEIRGQMVGQLQSFKERMYDAKGEPVKGILPSFISRRGRVIKAAHFQLETIMNRWDKFDPNGVWNQYIMRPLIEGANQEAAWRKDYAKRLRDLSDGEDMGKLVNNILFRDPQGGPLFNLNRGNLRAIMLNTGTQSNMVKLARGYGLEPAQVMDWIHSVAKKEDWDFVQKTWDNIFKDIKAKSDTMYRSLTGGVPAEDIPAQAINTPYGKYEGGYYPVIFHPEFEGKSKKLMGKDALEQDGFYSAMTPAGYTKARTGYVAPLALDLDIMPGRISQMLHDIALRPAVINASKVFKDQVVRETIRKHYGGEYRDLLDPYLRDVANASNYMSRPQRAMNQMSEFIRQNMISTLVGLNPGTVLKHGPTAWVQSMQEVGPKNFLSAVKSLWSINEETGETNWKFAMTHSQELQRRDVNWQEGLTGATADLVPKNTYQALRQNVIKLSAKPVAMSDMVSAVPTWLAQYKKSTGEGATFGDAVYDADRAVRRAHGSTAITNRPGIMRDTNPWLTSVYNFFNHIMNRQAEMVWRAGDSFDLAKAGEWDKAKTAFQPVIGQLFSYVIAPAIVEELVSPLSNDEHESWGKKAAKGLAFTLGASWVGVRDLVNGILHGSDPSVGLASTAAKETYDFIRDAMKDQPTSRDHMGRLLQDAAGFAGTFTGLVPQQIGKAARFMYDTNTGQEHPRGPWAWLTGLRYGTLNKHSTSWDNWMKGR